MENWDEIKTAYHVAKMGTVSGAAEVLGVHHATVIRHIDALERSLGVKLFQRHARGYSPTEAGDDLFRVAEATNDQIGQLVSRIKGRGNDVSGELVITSLAVLAPRLTGVLQEFQSLHPDVTIRYLTGDRLFRLEYGEAHVAIRAGTVPDQPDNVVQPFVRQHVGLFAATSYIERFGRPQTAEDLAQHTFVGPDDEGSRAPFNKWLSEFVPRDRVTFRATDALSTEFAIRAGAGIGFMPVLEARSDPSLVEILEPRESWSAPLWLVTHVDLHRTTKVQTFLTFLKEKAKGWEL